NRVMSRRLFVIVFAGLVWQGSVGAQRSPLVETVAGTGFIQLEAPSFAKLTPQQKQLAYWLTQASIAIDPIFYDQLSEYGLRPKRLPDGGLGTRAAGRDPAHAR